MVIDNMETYNFDCASIRLYLKKKKKTDDRQDVAGRTVC